jgi:predicted metalloprotease
MKWMGRRQSTNVDDRRGMSGGKLVAGGGIIGVIVLLLNLFMGGDNSGLIEGLDSIQGTGESRELTAAEKEEAAFIKTLVADHEDIWAQIFRENGAVFENPKLVLFSQGVSTGCGSASSAAGPFYCPADRTIYMDLTFFNELQQRFGAKGGDFAVAYVLAHEMGHHVQTLLGTSGKVREMQQNASETQANKLSVALELQADFYAGIWTHYNEQMNQILEPGDIEEALSAANAVGDDAIQKRTQGHVVPDSFTHGTSEQRMYWFNKGFKTGDVKQGDTFGGL